MEQKPVRNYTKIGYTLERTATHLNYRFIHSLTA